MSGRFFRNFSFLLLSVLATVHVFAFDKDATLKAAQAETDAVKKAALYNLLSVETINTDPEESKKYAELALKASGDHRISEADSRMNYGIALYYLDDYTQGIREATQALKIYEEEGDKEKQGIAENIIGEIYVYTSRYAKALKHLSVARKILEKTNNKTDLARCYNNLGIIHKNDLNTEEALVYFRKAYKLGDQVRKGDASLYMGEVYLIQQRYTDAESHLQEAIKLAGLNEDNYVLADAMIGMARVKAFYGKREEAMSLFRKSLTIKEEVEDQQGIAIVSTGIGNLYLQMNNAEEAHSWFIRGAAVAAEIHTKEELRNAYLGLSNTYHLKDMDDSAYTFLHLYNQISQEILSAEASKKLASLERALEEDKRKQQQEQERFMNRVRIYIAAGLILFLLVIAYVMYRRFKEKKKSNEAIMKQRDELNLQKMIIEEKNKEITDSINYACRIQMAMLNDANQFNSFFRDSFILFKPKDIVSGDFFWFAEKNGKVIYATADCTGHGVPGGFMSMMGVSLLNEVVLERGVTDAGKILDLLRGKIIAGMKQTGAEGENKDGMDIVLVVFDPLTLKMQYAAANNGFYIIRNREIQSYHPHKQPIGYFAYGMTDFPAHEIQLEKGDRIYTFTDGFADQFGGPRGKKYKYKQLEETLLSIHEQDMRNQHSFLDERITEWQGDLEQNDDICLIGVHIQ